VGNNLIKSRTTFMKRDIIRSIVFSFLIPKNIYSLTYLLILKIFIMKKLIKILFIMFLTPCFVNAQVTLGTNNSTSGSDGTYIGDNAGAFNTAANNVFLGNAAGYANTTGSRNTALGRAAGYSNYIGFQNTFVGSEAGHFSSTNYNTFIGERSGYSTTSGTYNTFLGRRSGYTNKTGKENTFLGMNAGYANTTHYNTFVGTSAGRYNTSGINNTFLGRRTGYNNKVGKNNTFVGMHAGYDSKGNHNTFVGTSAGRYNTTGTYNTFLGLSSGFEVTTGKYNTYLGVNAGRKNKTGERNVFIGQSAGYNETGSEKLYIDNNSDENSPLIYGDFASHYVGIAIDPAADIVNTNAYGLYVGKGILADKVKVAARGTGNWADYVFETDYDLNSTEEVETFIKENKHLPNVPSAADVSKNGVDMVEMDATLLRQIEELWLHVIELKKESETVKAENEILKTRINTLENR